MAKEFPDVTFDCTIKGETHVRAVDPGLLAGCFEAAWSVSVAYPGETCCGWMNADRHAIKTRAGTSRQSAPRSRCL